MATKMVAAWSAEVKYNLEVEVMSNGSEQDTSDDDEPEDVYADKPLADKNWLAQYEAERKMEQQLEKKLQRRLSGTEELKEWFVLVWPVHHNQLLLTRY